MKNNYYYVSLLKSFKVITFMVFSFLINGLHAQAPSIQTGVTFQWDGNQANNSSPAIIESVTIDGTLYNTFVVPSTYNIDIGTSNHAVNQLIENGVTKPINSSLPGWDALALDAFQDKNLNHYFAANPNGANICGNYPAALNTTVQRQTLSYGVPIPSNDGGVLAVTERGGNNCFYVEVYGTPVGGGPEQKLGQTFVVNNGNHYGSVFQPPVAGSDYWRSGRVNNNGQTIAIALFYLNDLAPTGSSITRIEFIGASTDHGDGKFFLLQKYAVDQQVIECLDETYNGDLNVLNNEPANSTYTLISGPSNAGQSFTLNSDGTYTYEPTPGFIGDVTFTYELCLPAPNTSVCDTGSVTLSYVDLPPEPTYEIDCSGGDDNFTLTVTSPLNSATDPNQYEYSVDGTNFQTSPEFNGLAEGTYTVTVKSTYTTCVRTASSDAELINDSEIPTGTAPTGESGINLCSADAQTSYPFNGATVAANYTDNCSTSVSVNLTDTSLSGDNCGWTLTYTYEVVDNSGNKIEDESIIYSGSDQTAPTGNAPSGQTGINSCTANAETNAPFDAATVASAYSDNCTNVSVSLTKTEITGDDCSWTLTYTYDVLDECNNKLEGETITHSGGNQTALSFLTEASDLTVECNGDNSADLINWITSYAGATVADSCTEITWSDNFSDLDIDCGNAGSGEVTFTATDACGNSVSTTATFTVEDTTAPTLPTTPEDVTYECIDEVPSPEYLTASDACSGDYNSIGVDTIDDSDACNIIITRTWTFTDSCNNTSSTSQIITVKDTTGPVLDLPDNVTAECSDDLTPIAFGTATATDNCDPNPVVTYNDVITNGACEGTYTITRTWIATDACGNETTADQTISTSDSTPPVFDQVSLPGDLVVECDAVPEAITLTATDNCGDAIVTVDDEITQGNCDQNYTITRTYTATDDCGLTNTHIQTITVQDTTAPEFVEALPLANIVVECDAVPMAETLTATDICGSATVSVSDVRTDGDCLNSYTIARTWTATDECGLTTSFTQNIIVQDTTAPTFNETMPRDITVECDAVPDAETITASDNCGEATVTVVDTRTDGNCISNYTISRVWTATDECGLTTTHTQTITVQDTTAPVPTSAYDEVLDVSCTDIPDTPALSFEDNCSENITVSFEEVSTFVENVFEDYQITRTWTVMDECANEAIYTQTLNVTLDEIYSEVTAEDICYNNGAINLNDLLSSSINTNGNWEIIEGDLDATLTGSIFDPTTLELSEDFLPESGGIDYRLRYTTTDQGCLSIIEVVMNVHADCVVLPCGENDINISKAITPNGDGINDTFDIEGIDLCGFVAEVKIFNRWGALVYESNNYTLGSIKTSGAQGDWDGSSPKSSVGNAGKLPNGTYYYIIKLRDSGLNPLTGPIYLGTK